MLACAVATPARADVRFTETEDFRIVYYDPGETPLVPHATQSFLAAMANYKRLLPGYGPFDRVNILLQDFSDRGNAGAMPAPRNRIFFDVAASSEPYETIAPGDRFAWTAAHELTHIVFWDAASPIDAKYRRLFHGKVEVDSAHPESLLYYYLTVPRATTPRWYVEGNAVFMETWIRGGIGRAQGGYDEMVFRAMVQDGAQFYDPLGLVSKGTEIDFKTGANAYLYGTRFTDYLALTYGPQRLLDWWRRSPESRRYYADDFKRVYGLPLDQAWNQWIQWEHDFQQKNIQAVREHPITEYHDLTRKDLGGVSRGCLSADGSRFYAGVEYPGQVPHLVSIDRRNGKVSELAEVKGTVGYMVTSLACDPANDTLFYTMNNGGHRDLHALDLRTGKSRMLLNAARIGDIVFNQADRSLWGLRMNNGFAMVVRIPYPYEDWKTLYVFPSGRKAFDLDLSPDGTLASMSVVVPGAKPGSPQVTQVWVLRTAALMNGDAKPLHALTMGSSVPEGFAFSRDGRYLYGSSYFTGVSNIFRYEIETENLEAVTNADIGFFRPLPLEGSQLIVMRYTAKGFMPTLIEARPTEDLSAITFLGERISAQYPEVRRWAEAPPSSMPYESQIQRQGSYNSLHELSLESLIPIVQGYRNSVAAGASARFSDPLGFDALDIEASYSPDSTLPSRQRAHFAADLHHARWSTGVAWNSADFYDLFGPTKRSLAGYSGYVGYDLPLAFELPKVVDFSAKVAYFGDLDTLPGAQNVTSPSSHLFTADAGFLTTDTRFSPGSVDEETGHTWSLFGTAKRGNGSLIPSLTGTFDLGFPLPINHSSVWLRTGAAISSGARSDPLANFYIGGFGNNYVDSGGNGGAQRYRELQSMPGFDIDALNGKSLVKGTLEWCLPPLRFEAVGSPGFYLTWIRPEIFASGLVTDPNNSAYRQSSSDIGMQLDFQLQTMHRLPMMLSIGVAQGFGGTGLGRTEFMLSFQVL